MKVYLDITLLPKHEVGLYFLWGKVFQQIHIGLVEMKNASGLVPIGVAFQEYDAKKSCLGNKLRLLAESEDVLREFDVHKWLSRFSDYIHLTQIRSVPEQVKSFVAFKRQQTKTNIERLARRKAKRQGISIEQAMKELEGFEDQLIRTPFINMESQSTEKKRFRLFIKKQSATNLISDGFTTYGLSRGSTVPEF